MASAPATGLPLLYKDIVPLSSATHADWKLKPAGNAEFLRNVHAVPLLAEEIVAAHIHYPVVFSSGPEIVPLALMGLNEGVNVLLDENGLFPADTYIPAYIRRYPFLLAKLTAEAEDLSLCVDPASGMVGAFDEGEALFEGGQASERIKTVLDFCETFERGSQATGAFIRELGEQKLLQEGEFKIQPTDATHPYIYRGFQMVSEDALKNLRGDVARRWIQSGALPLIYAHLFSLNHLTGIFARQTAQGKTPPPPMSLNL